jgi:hypothetical protein
LCAAVGYRRHTLDAGAHRVPQGDSERLMNDLLKLPELCLNHVGECDPMQLAIHDFTADGGPKAS